MSTTIKVCPVCLVSWYADKPEKHMMTCTQPRPQAEQTPYELDAEAPNIQTVTLTEAEIQAYEIAEIEKRSKDDDDEHPNGLADQSCKDRATLLRLLRAKPAAKDAT
tara:strand:- start:13159 stop:13479 length:321 start_codon:yes stop_codon:yes gene_type:complete